MNKILLIGNLVRDPELQTTASGICFVNIDIAVKRNYQNAEGEYEVDFLKCVAWKKTAEVINKYSKKGSKIGIVGNLQNRTYKAVDGTNRYITEIMIEEIDFIGGNKENANN